MSKKGTSLGRLVSVLLQDGAGLKIVGKKELAAPVLARPCTYLSCSNTCNKQDKKSDPRNNIIIIDMYCKDCQMVQRD